MPLSYGKSTFQSRPLRWNRLGIVARGRGGEKAAWQEALDIASGGLAGIVGTGS
jgi:hypothetical protein